jgi:hypothetical protein
LIVVAEMVDLLLRSEVEKVHFLFYPVFSGPVDVSVECRLGLGPAAVLQRISYTVLKVGSELDLGPV